MKARNERLVTIGKVTYSVEALESALERAKQRKKRTYEKAIAAGRSESCAVVLSTHNTNPVIKRLTKWIACANARSET